jgi:hypothetical protein
MVTDNTGIKLYTSQTQVFGASVTLITPVTINTIRKLETLGLGRNQNPG